MLADGVVIGRIMKAPAAPVGQPWLWTLAFGQHEDRWPTHGYAARPEAAMAAFGIRQKLAARMIQRVRTQDRIAGAGYACNARPPPSAAHFLKSLQILVQKFAADRNRQKGPPKRSVNSRRKALASALSSLNDRERRIFEARRLAEEPITLKVLADEFGISRERVRQIGVRAFEKVQKSVKNGVAVMETPAPLPAH